MDAQRPRMARQAFQHAQPLQTADANGLLRRLLAKSQTAAGGDDVDRVLARLHPRQAAQEPQSLDARQLMHRQQPRLIGLYFDEAFEPADGEGNFLLDDRLVVGFQLDALRPTASDRRWLSRTRASAAIMGAWKSTFVVPRPKLSVSTASGRKSMRAYTLAQPENASNRKRSPLQVTTGSAAARILASIAAGIWKRARTTSISACKSPAARRGCVTRPSKKYGFSVFPRNVASANRDPADRSSRAEWPR